MTKTRKTKTAAKPRAKAALPRRTRAAAAPATRSIVQVKFRERYGKDGTCGDELAAALHAATRPDGKTLDLDALAAVAEANGIESGRWAHLNPGQRRNGRRQHSQGEGTAGRTRDHGVTNPARQWQRLQWTAAVL
jgi:hypothetical protein